MEEVFTGCENKVREFSQEMGASRVEEVWSKWKEKVLVAVEKEMGKKKITER